MTPLFYATSIYAYDGVWTLGKEYPIYKISLASSQYTTDFMFLTINDEREFATLNCCYFKYDTALDIML